MAPQPWRNASGTSLRHFPREASRDSFRLKEAVMEKYLEDFICNLQEAAEAAGKDFDPAAQDRKSVV